VAASFSGPLSKASAPRLAPAACPGVAADRRGRLRLRVMVPRLSHVRIRRENCRLANRISFIVWSKIRASVREFMKLNNARKTVATVAEWFFGEHGLTYLDLTKDRPEWTGLQEHEPFRYKMFTAEDADFLRELQIVADPADCLQPGEKTLGRQILERFWEEDR